MATSQEQKGEDKALEMEKGNKKQEKSRKKERETVRVKERNFFRGRFKKSDIFLEERRWIFNVFERGEELIILR